MHTACRVKVRLILVTLVFTLIGSLAAPAHAQEAELTTRDDFSSIWWGTLAFESALVGMAAIAPLFDGSNTGKFLAGAIPLSMATIGGTFMAGHLAHRNGWPSDGAAATMAFLHMGLSGYAIGCSASLDALPENTDWDVGAFDSCNDRALPWLVGGAAGLLSAVYMLVRGNRLYRDRSHDRLEVGLYWTTMLAPMFSLLLVTAVDTYVRAVQSARNGTKLSAAPGLYNRRPGHAGTMGAASLAAFATAVTIAEIRF